MVHTDNLCQWHTKTDHGTIIERDNRSGHMSDLRMFVDEQQDKGSGR
jgi:hypothetical protein